MGLTRSTLTCILWIFLVLVDFTSRHDLKADGAVTDDLQSGVAEPRGRHRLQLLFPLLLRISTRLATLIPTALSALLGIIVFVIFSKKALIISLFALFLTLAGKYNVKNEDIYIHKINSYPDYNDEEHIHYHHHGPPKYKKYYYGTSNWEEQTKRGSLPFSNGTPLRNDYHVPFKPIYYSVLKKKLSHGDVQRNILKAGEVGSRFT